MKKQNQTPITVSLEVAKVMKAVWREKKTFLAYNYWSDGDYRLYLPWIHELKLDLLLQEIIYSPTAQEILDELPYKIWSRSFIHMWKTIELDGKEYAVWYTDFWNDELVKNITWTSLSESLAKLRLRCKEEWYIE